MMDPTLRFAHEVENISLMRESLIKLYVRGELDQDILRHIGW